VTIARTIARKPTVPERDIQIPYQVVDRPAGGTQAERTLLDLLQFATLADIAAAYATLFDVAAGP
jgi:hypothetical protein